MVDHTLEAHFEVDVAVATERNNAENQAREERIVVAMVIAMNGGEFPRSQQKVLLLMEQARTIFRAVSGMLVAMAAETR